MAVNMKRRSFQEFVEGAGFRVMDKAIAALKQMRGFERTAKILSKMISAEELEELDFDDFAEKVQQAMAEIPFRIKDNLEKTLNERPQLLQQAFGDRISELAAETQQAMEDAGFSSHPVFNKVVGFLAGRGIDPTSITNASPRAFIRKMSQMMKYFGHEGKPESESLLNIIRQDPYAAQVKLAGAVEEKTPAKPAEPTMAMPPGFKPSQSITEPKSWEDWRKKAQEREGRKPFKPKPIQMPPKDLGKLPPVVTSPAMPPVTDPSQFVPIPQAKKMVQRAQEWAAKKAARSTCGKTSP